MKTSKEAQRDAHELARASMFFGEGAGNRRKLIQASVQQKLDRDPNGYGVAFYRAIDREDMAEHAEAARKERKKIDRKEALHKNTHAVLSGNKQHIRSNLVLLGLVAVAAHKSGYDKVALEEGKKYYRKGKAWVTYKYRIAKAKREQHPVPKVTDLNN